MEKNMENEMETGGINSANQTPTENDIRAILGHIGIMEKRMETTI